MHPLIKAEWNYREWVALNIRPWSPYYPQWVRGCDEAREWLYEMKCAFGLV